MPWYRTIMKAQLHGNQWAAAGGKSLRPLRSLVPPHPRRRITLVTCNGMHIYLISTHFRKLRLRNPHSPNLRSEPVQKASGANRESQNEQRCRILIPFWNIHVCHSDDDRRRCGQARPGAVPSSGGHTQKSEGKGLGMTNRALQPQRLASRHCVYVSLGEENPGSGAQSVLLLPARFGTGRLISKIPGFSCRPWFLSLSACPCRS